MEKHLGSCQCQKVQFEIAGPFESFFLCHCKFCQKDTGSAHAANLFATQATIRWVAGQDQVRTFNIPNTRHVKGFCVTCGSAVPNVQMDGKLLVVPAGSLDSDIATKPNAHIFTSSKACWDQNLEAAPSFATFPS